MSYRKKHIKSKIHRIKPHKPIFKRLWFWILILSLIIILSVSYSILFYSGFQLKNIVILGNQKVKNQDLYNATWGLSQIQLAVLGNFRIISQSIFLANKNKIISNLLENFSGIEKISIKKEFPQTLVLNITERSPLGAYCPEKRKEGCFLIDSNGIIFELPDRVADNLSVIRQDFSGAQVVIGQEVISPQIADIIYKIKVFLQESIQADVQDAFIASPFRLNITTTENWQIYFDLSAGSDFNLQITKLGLLLDGEIFAGSEGYPRQNLKYIDLRPKDRAIVCDNNICASQ